MPKTTERVHFRLIRCPAEVCGTLLCCVNPRFYNYCPECGTRIYEQIRACVLISDADARLTYNPENQP